MGNKKSCVIYDSWGEIIMGVPKDIAGEIIQAICVYTFKGEETEFENPATPGIFAMIKQKLDEDSQKYEETKRKRAEAGGKGNAARWGSQKIANDRKCDKVIANDRKQSQMIAVSDSVSVSVSDSVSDSVSNTESPTETKKDIPARHRRGEYGHVLLSDRDVEKLEEEYGTAMAYDCIAFLDEYMERKGYKAKNHYLTIRKWVVDAVRKEQGRASPHDHTSPHDYMLGIIQGGM